MSLIHYLLQVNIYLLLFYSLYKVLLANETYFTINRIYLVGVGVLSMSIPFIRLNYFAKQEIKQQVYIGLDQLITQATVATNLEQHFNWGALLGGIYLFGVIIGLTALTLKLLHIKKLFKAIGNTSAFSFINKKKVGADLPEHQTIAQHEETHVKQLHSLDVLFFEILAIINWFNPISYLYKAEIKNIHEYLADEAAAKFQGDKKMYALLLLSHALKVSPNTLTNSFFNKKMLKKRIYMLHKQRSKNIAVLKYGTFVPLFALALVLSSSTIRENETIQRIANQITLTDLADAKLAINAPVNAVHTLTTEIKKENLELKNKKKMKNTIKTALIAASTVFATNAANAQVDTVKGSSIHKQEYVTPKTKTDTAKNKPLVIVDGKIITMEDLNSSFLPDDIESMHVFKDASALAAYGDKGKYGVVMVITKSGAPGNAEFKKFVESFEVKTKQSLEPSRQITGAEVKKLDKKGLGDLLHGKSLRLSLKDIPDNAYILLDKKSISREAMNNLDPNSITSVEVLKDKAAAELYGARGKNGVIIITTHNNLTYEKKEEPKAKKE